ncbi:hypothetical protein Acsp02_75190 [Actinoplanes sp. NBRC 103695]|nr:hypothetical protein Acsp02_75190 [Actinoplanes sp. NBRC 103695]
MSNRSPYSVSRAAEYASLTTAPSGACRKLSQPWRDWLKADVGHYGLMGNGETDYAT